MSFVLLEILMDNSLTVCFCYISLHAAFWNFTLSHETFCMCYLCIRFLVVGSRKNRCVPYYVLIVIYTMCNYSIFTLKTFLKILFHYLACIFPEFLNEIYL